MGHPCKSMSRQTQVTITVVATALVAVLSACTARQPMVIEELDEGTAASVTYSQTSIALSPDKIFVRANERPYLNLGAIRVNRNRNRQYFIWLGIWDTNYAINAERQPKEFESIVLVIDGEELPLHILTWNHEVIGTSKPVYKKIFDEALDAYYQLTLEQMLLLVGAEVIKVRTAGATPREFVPWYREENARSDLAEFLRRISE